jgi:hypothetical protein
VTKTYNDNGDDGNGGGDAHTEVLNISVKLQSGCQYDKQSPASLRTEMAAKSKTRSGLVER